MTAPALRLELALEGLETDRHWLDPRASLELALVDRIACGDHPAAPFTVTQNPAAVECPGCLAVIATLEGWAPEESSPAELPCAAPGCGLHRLVRVHREPEHPRFHQWVRP